MENKEMRKKVKDAIKGVTCTDEINKVLDDIPDGEEICKKADNCDSHYGITQKSKAIMSVLHNIDIEKELDEIMKNESKLQQNKDK
jgi:hypothetical protein